VLRRRRRAVHAILKEKGATFYSSEWQKEMATRSLARPDALEIRSRGGRIGGINRNLGIAIKSNDRYLFFYKGQPVLCIINCETGGQVMEQLQLYKQTNMKRVTPLLKGSRATAYGWRCEKIEIQNETKRQSAAKLQMGYSYKHLE
jgi:hypothetical protein